MKYLTKEWCELCQQTGLHFGMKAHNGTDVYDEALYLRLYKRKEKEFVKMQHEIYDINPRFMLKDDGCTLVPLDKFVNKADINEEDKVVYHMPPGEKERIQKLIAEYDVRPPFDEEKSTEEFRFIQKTVKKETIGKLPHELLVQIADVRVFSLGYCTKEILRQLKKLSKENEREMKRVLKDYSKAQQAEKIPQIIREKFGFHDCKVTEFTVNKEAVIMWLDTRGGFTNFNMITFINSEIIKLEEHIVGSTWLYQELYRKDSVYEVHMLFANEKRLELIIRCNDIIIDEK